MITLNPANTFSTRRLARWLAFLAAFVSLTVGLAVQGISVAHAEESRIETFKAFPSTTQAGGHPDVRLTFAVDTNFTLPPSDCACQNVKEITIRTPEGLVGDPHAVPTCSSDDFALVQCPVAAQIGIAEADLGLPGASGFGIGVNPVYNLVPHPGQAGLIGFMTLIGVPVYEVISSRTGSDYGLNVTVAGITQAIPLAEFQQKLWGVPADPSHDGMRFPYKEGDCFYTSVDATSLNNGNPDKFSRCNLVGTEGVPFPPVPSNSPIRPFTENPTSCGKPLAAGFGALYYDHTAFQAEYSWPPTTGCDQLSFDPSLFAQPTTRQTDSASGADVDLQVPQEVAASVPSPSEIHDLSITLPQGFSINPNAADGKTACLDAEAQFGTEGEAHCPENSKVGTATLSTSLLPAPIPGYIYLGKPLPGNRYRIFLTADGFSVHVKLAGEATPDPQTGQLTVSFANLPQTPFEDFNLHFFGSEHGFLATPTQCGTYAVNSTFVPWDAALPEQHSTQFFSLDSGPSGQSCPSARRPFNPKFSAAVATNTSGIHAPFSLELTRSDGDQNISGLTVSTPPGFSATLSGIPYCPDASLARAAEPSYSGLSEEEFPSCPATSKIGTATAGAGAGNHPVYLPGKVYLAGPYKSAPLSLAVITPAVSGPYDLGNVVVRAALHVDPTDAHVTAVSDPLPQILQGIPLRLRFIQINLDKPSFTLNPTDCDPLSVNATVSGDQGAQAKLSYPFQVANCADLPFAPKLSLRLSGGVHRLGHPAIHAVVRTQPGEANARSISVTLPSNELLDNSHINTVCTKVDFANQSCPSGALLGHAEVTSPLLDQPLQGSAYLRSSGNGLPDLALDLYGQFHIEVVARIDAVNGGLRTTFKAVPDVPLGTVALDLQGGSKGLLQNSEGLCAAHRKARVEMTGQNGKSLTRKISMQAQCGKRSKHERKVHKTRRAN